MITPNDMKDTPRRLFLACQIAVMLVITAPWPQRADAQSGANPDLRPQTDTEARGPYGATLLHWMAFRGDADRVSELIVDGAEVNDRVDRGATPLHLAAYRGHVEVVRRLIAHGAAVNARTDAGITPLDWAARNGHDEVVSLLLANGARHGPGWQGDHRETSRPPPGPPSTGASAALDLAIPERVTGAAAAGDGRIHVADTRGARSVSGDAPGPDSVRIQLAAVSSEQRAIAAWDQFRRRHADILAGLDLVMDSVTVQGRLYYRVQAGYLRRPLAESLCDRLRQRQQPCHLVAGAPVARCCD